MNLRWPKWGSFDMSELWTQLCYETNWSETRKLFGSLREAPTCGEEPTLREMLWSPFGWLGAAAFGVFAHKPTPFPLEMENNWLTGSVDGNAASPLDLF